MVPQGLEGVFLVLLVNSQGIGTDEIPRLMLMVGVHLPVAAMLED